MEKFYSNIIGTPIFEDDEVRPATTIKDIVIDPDTGKILAFVVNLTKNLVILPIDIVSLGDVIRINSVNVITEASEIIKVNEILSKNIKIFNNNVVTKGGKYLGKVIDFSIDSESLYLQKIFVSKVVLGLLKYGNRIFQADKILKILPNKIVVKADFEPIKESSVEAILEDAVAG